MEAAAKNGDAMLVEWIDRHYRIDFEEEPVVLDKAVEAGRPDLMKWLLRHNYRKCAFLAVQKAAEKGRLDMIDWLIDNKLGEATQALADAARCGQLALARQLYSKYRLEIRASPSVSGSTMLAAAKTGHLETVKWLFETFGEEPEIELFKTTQRTSSGILQTCYSEAMDEAAKNGYLSVVAYLHEVAEAKSNKKRKRGGTLQGTVPRCSTEAMDQAVANNHLEVVQWLHQNRREGCTYLAMNLAASNGHLEMVKWLHAHRSEGCTSDVMDGAPRGGHLAVVQWLDENTSAHCTTAAMDGSAENGHLDVVKWLHEHRSEGCTTKAMDGAAAGRHFHVVKWLDRNRSEGYTTDAIDSAADDLEGETEMHREGCTRDAFRFTDDEASENIHAWLEDHYSSVK